MPIVLLPQDSRNEVFQGVLDTKSASYTFCLRTPEYPSTRNIVISVSWDLQQVLRKAEINMQEIVANCETVDDLVQKMDSRLIANELGPEKPLESTLWNSADYLTLVSEVHKIGWDKCVDLGADMRSVVLRAKDVRERIHLITIKLIETYPTVPPIITTDLPEDFQLLWQPNASFKFIYDEFVECLIRFQEFWDIMDDLDENSWVLEPEYPKRKDTTRRIAIIEHQHPTLFPIITPIGSDFAIKQLVPQLLTLELEWEDDLSIVANIERHLGVKLPRPTVQDGEEWEVECGICFSFRLEGEAPSVICEEERCNRQYHASCLYDWLQGLPTSRLMGNKIYGECLNCTSPISMNIITISRQELC